MRPAEEAEVFVEAALQRVELRLVAEVRFAEPARRVAGLLEAIGQGRFLQGKAKHGRSRGRRSGVKLVSEALLIPPRQQTRPSRAAIRPAHIAASETDAILRQRIDMRRGDLRIALHAQLAVAEIIGDDEENVRARTAFARRAEFSAKRRVEELCQRERQQEFGSKEERVSFHADFKVPVN